MNRMLALLSVIAALSGCSASVGGTLTDNQGGHLSLDITLSPALQGYWNDLRSADPTLPAEMLDNRSMGRTFAQYPETRNVTLTKTAAGRYRLDLDFSQGQALSQRLAGKSLPLFAYSQRGSDRVLTFRLSQETLQTLIKMTGLAETPALEVFLAGGEGELTKDEYTELLGYFLEPYDKNPAVAIGASKVEVKLAFPSTPKRTTGGRIEGNRAVFTAPLVDLLLLEKPLVWEVMY